MIKKIVAKLAGFRELARGQKQFHQREVIERENAEERRQQAMTRAREELRAQMERRKTPSETEILGPSDSGLKEPQE